MLKNIRELGLEQQLTDLETNGLTVVPPDLATSGQFVERLHSKVLQVAKTRSGIEPDVKYGRTHADIEKTAGQTGEMWLWRLLLEDPIFEKELMNPVSLALITSLLGYSAKLSSSSAIIKGPVTIEGSPQVLNLHSDNRGIPAPFPKYAQVANVTWALSDYTLENGCLGYVPRSHLLCRRPKQGEALNKVVPVEAEAGSLIVWHGNTWHDPFPRESAGLRVSMMFYFCREYLTTQERYEDEVPQDMFARNEQRFSTLMGLNDPYGWDASGPDMSRLQASCSGESLHA